ncbi:uncharacterized protein LOC129617260 [Condylostylus longicornis]|uniref:uncharacterized protein LOC129617260 n=1 Tax=Condylostylus longicornis TaxID=2530218 RepID=UPI00244E286A|nr:uncharacterized protein LOC129617260 [Condylostylus longicornis]
MLSPFFVSVFIAGTLAQTPPADYDRGTCGAQHDAVGARLGKIESLIQKADHCVTKIEETTAKIVSMKETIAIVQEQIDSQKEAADKAPENCATVPGYEDDPFPDGLRGSYYKNPFFRGNPLYRNDENIDFQWTGKDPLEGIPNEGREFAMQNPRSLPVGFAIRWDGYVKVEADCGARIFLNGQPIVADRMPPPSSKDATGEKEVLLLPPSEHDGPKSVESAPVVLNGGEKNRIRSLGNGRSMVSISTLHYTRLDPNYYEISFLYDGEYAHKDELREFVAITVSQWGKNYSNPANPNTDSASIRCQYSCHPVSCSADCKVAHCESSTESFFSRVLRTLSVHATELLRRRETSFQSMKLNQELHERKLATHLTIYKTEILKPKLYTVNLLKPKTPFVAFLMPRKDAEGACGGTPIHLSKPNSVAYESCEASSFKTSEFGCQYG